MLIGVWGANFHALDASAVFATLDYDLFLLPEPDNLLEAWRACDELGLSLSAGGEPLDTPRDRPLAQAGSATTWSSCSTWTTS